MSDSVVEIMKAAIAEKFAPAIEFKAPYAKIMLEHSARAALSALEEAGYVVVPKKPTEAMENAGRDEICGEALYEEAIAAWSAMIAAFLAEQKEKA